MSEFDEQVLPQVQQLRAERANAEAYGNGPLVERIERQLAALRRREAAEQAVESESEARQQAPQGRRAARRETADGA